MATTSVLNFAKIIFMDFAIQNDENMKIDSCLNSWFTIIVHIKGLLLICSLMLHG